MRTAGRLAASLSRSQMLVLASLVTVSGFFGGALSGRLFPPRAAQADSPSTTMINVGQQGLVFRGPDGRVIARLASDPTQGGYFELYNAQEQPGARMRAGAFTGTIDAYPQPNPIPAPGQTAPPRSQGPAVARDMGF